MGPLGASRRAMLAVTGWMTCHPDRLDTDHARGLADIPDRSEVLTGDLGDRVRRRTTRSLRRAVAGCAPPANPPAPQRPSGTASTTFSAASTGIVAVDDSGTGSTSDGSTFSVGDGAVDSSGSVPGAAQGGAFAGHGLGDGRGQVVTCATGRRLGPAARRRGRLRRRYRHGRGT